VRRFEMTNQCDTQEGLESGRLEEMEESECWRLLSSRPVGRVAVIVGHYPLVFPVNHAVDERSIIFRTAVGTKLWATHHSNVTFEVDDFDPARKDGWSVMVRGSARELSPAHHAELAERTAGAGASPWAPGDREHLIRIVADSISGRRIRPSGDADG
jgi:uncharacterized protein